jgi:hypothetical protein
MALVWIHPFTATVSGPTSCGKSSFVICFIQHAYQIMSPQPSSIMWCYGAYQPVFETLPNVKFHEGIPDVSQLVDGYLLILDDLMQEANDQVTKIFKKFSHHRNISVMFLTQNLFHKNVRSITLNSHYLVLFKNPRDAQQISHLARQMFPKKSKYMQEAFSDATSKPYSYLVVDLRADTDDSMRLRSGIFPDEDNFAYVSK